MAQPTGSNRTTLTGVVEHVNERGIKLNGGWLNVSKFHPVALPMRGARVALTVKDGRWIERVDVLTGKPRILRKARRIPSGKTRASARSRAWQS